MPPMTAHNGNPADSPKPAQCDQPGCYVWTPHTHYDGPQVTLTAMSGGRVEEFVEFRPLPEKRNLVHWHGVYHTTGPDCPCQPGARPHDGTVLDPDGDAVVIDDSRSDAELRTHRDNLAAMVQRLSEYLDSVSLNSWKHGACWAAEDAIRRLLAEREDLVADVLTKGGCTDPDRREGHCCGTDA